MAFKEGKKNGKPIVYQENDVSTFEVTEGPDGKYGVVATMGGSGDRIFIPESHEKREDADAYVSAAAKRIDQHR